MHDELLQRHLELVLEANKKTNITRISSWDEGMVLHVQDSLLGLEDCRKHQTDGMPISELVRGILVYLLRSRQVERHCSLIQLARKQQY